MKSRPKRIITSVILAPEDHKLLEAMAGNVARSKVQIVTAALRLLGSMTTSRDKFGELVLDLLNGDRRGE